MTTWRQRHTAAHKTAAKHHMPKAEKGLEWQWRHFVLNCAITVPSPITLGNTSVKFLLKKSVWSKHSILSSLFKTIVQSFFGTSNTTVGFGLDGGWKSFYGRHLYRAITNPCVIVKIHSCYNKYFSNKMMTWSLHGTLPLFLAFITGLK